MRSLKADEIQQVVVRATNWVGDAVMILPALQELRRILPKARITLAARSWVAGVFEESEFVDELMPIDPDGPNLFSFIHQAREWRRRKFDLAVLLPNALAPALLAFAGGVPLRVGYATKGRRPLLTHPFGVPTWRNERHEVFYYLNVVAELERTLNGSSDIQERMPRVELTISESRRRAAQVWLEARGVRFERPLVALCPGSTNSRAKRWPSERFAAVGDMLSDSAGAEVLLMGSFDERDVINETASKMRSRPIVLTGETTLKESAAVLSLCDLLVTNDTGPAHLADAVGCSVIVIFGPTNPVTTRPFSDTAIVVRQPPECAPCMLRDCPIDHRCMTAISPQAVFMQSMQILERGATPEAL